MLLKIEEKTQRNFLDSNIFFSQEFGNFYNSST